ncbi:MAG: GNAT family N-acetyltransferase [Acidimicrobiales bacterium]
MVIDDGLVERVERASAEDAAAVVAPLTALDPGLRSTALPLAGGQIVLLGPRMFVNRAMAIGLGTPMTSEDLAQLVDLSEQVAVPPELEVCPWAHRSVLSLASSRGFRPAWFRSTLVCELGSDQVAQAEGVRIEAVEDLTALARWQEMAASGFGYSTEAERRTSDLYARAAFGVPGEHLYLAHLDGRPVGVATLTVNRTTATLGGMATLALARRRGVQAALIRHRLSAATRFGCDIAVSTAEPGKGSERNLLRRGFTVMYSKLGMRLAASA